MMLETPSCVWFNSIKCSCLLKPSEGGLWLGWAAGLAPRHAKRPGGFSNIKELHVSYSQIIVLNENKISMSSVSSITRK